MIKCRFVRHLGGVQVCGWVFMCYNTLCASASIIMLHDYISVLFVICLTLHLFC